jgi:formylglycine-generating enzyme required for sulfatase activity
MAEAVRETAAERHVELLVRRAESGGKLELTYELHADDPHLGLFRRSFGSVRLREEPAALFQAILDDVSKLPVATKAQRNAAARRLQSKGSWLSQTLLPEPLRGELWSLAASGGEGSTILEIVTDEGSIPWELLCFQGGCGEGGVGGMFFGEVFAVTRWIAGARQVAWLPLTRVGLIVAGDSGLRSSEDEKEDLVGRAGNGRRVDEVPSRYDEVVSALASGEYDGWHFVGHGSARGTRSHHWRIALRRDEALEPSDLYGEAKGLGRSSPLVFLNACETGRAAPSLTGIGGWASSFLHAGAGAFLGPLWAVRDDRAAAFASEFYDRFLAGLPIGEAVRRTRLAIRDRFPGDPIWLAYAVYARPQVICGRAAAVDRSKPASGESAVVLGAVAARSAVPPEGSRPATPAPGAERRHDADGSLLLYVPGGEYTLGADDINDWTRPVHRVQLAPFWIARHPVTNEQYGRFLAAHPDATPPEFWQDERFDARQQPVVGVSWEDAEAYCRWVGLALPSEAQWEAAARGAEGRTYPWGNEPPEPRHANFGGRLGATSPVDAHPDGAGPFGTLDQAGNVWEWCADSWSLTAYRQRGEGAWNPVTRGDTSMRVLRGGSWVNPGRDLRAAYRDRATARLRFNTQGFRCVLPVESV